MCAPSLAPADILCVNDLVLFTDEEEEEDEEVDEDEDDEDVVGVDE